MFAKLDVFQMAHQMAIHAGRKQAIVAQNVANADTPDYKSRALPDFQDTFRADATASLQRATREGHLHGAAGGPASVATYEVKSAASPDGNTVSVETELLNSVAAKRQHDRALAIYKSSLMILRTAISK